MAYEDFIWAHPITRNLEAPPRKRARTAVVRDDAKAELLKQFPWLNMADFQAGKQPSSSGTAPRGRAGHARPAVPAPSDEGESAAESSAADDGSEAGSDDEVDAIEVGAELARLREEWDFEEGREMSWYTRVLGGRWTVQNKGVIADGVLGTCRASAKEWSLAYGWPRSRTYYFSRYTREGAHKLAEEFCRRSEHFYRLFVDDGAVDSWEFAYNQSHIDSYEESLEFISWLCEQDIESPMFAAGNDLRRLVPGQPARSKQKGA